jgi:hypothetical protein|tara:strand:- start:342 stop:548 length:207 start_codon:yes stop_codon:yes gene_type:complete
MISLINALKKRYEADIACSKANIQIYIDNPTGIGDHPDLVSALDSEVTKLCNAQDKLDAVNEHFGKPF